MFFQLIILGRVKYGLVSKLWDVITAMRVSSNTAALKELDGRDESYTVVAHSSLAPFLLTQGDYRTFGANIKFNIVETNVDSEIGRMWVVPTSLTTDNEIDLFGGIGICVAKDLLVVEGQVQQSDRQYRMIITQPAYQHHSLCPVIGMVEVADMDKLLGDEGLITAVNKHLAKISGSIETTGVIDYKELDPCGYTDVEYNTDGTIDCISLWYNGGGCLSETIEGAMK
ncbi:hypothetical protein AP1_0425 [Aeromonas phage AP1]|nr:hypothetical protein AP1_0425 [Aeromonas phage AP1]